MRIIGPDELIFGVDDLEACRTFLIDFGLTEVSRSDEGGTYHALDGTGVTVRRRDDPSLPQAIADRKHAAQDHLRRRGPGRARGDRGRTGQGS